MATSVFGSPIKKIYGETVALTTAAAHLGFMPGYHEVKLSCASDYRLGIAPRLASVKLFAASAYTDYTSQALDRVATTHVPLDGMTTAKWLYLGPVDPVRGFHFTIDGTNKNAVAATLDMEYCYDVSGPGYLTLTGTVTGALTVGETITGSTSGATGLAVYDDASTYLVIKTVAGSFQLGENAAGASQACNSITALAPTGRGIGYFTDVASDSDGTDSAGATLGASGLYSFTLPAVKKGAVVALNSEPLCWYRFKPSTTLSATIDITSITPACDTTNYGYEQGAVVQQFSLNVVQCGAFEFDHTATDTLYVDWIQH